MSSTRPLAWYFTGLTFTTYCLVVFGAVVRAKGAGLACPDWPLCFGELVPQLDFGVVYEWGHRALASVVSLGLLIGTIWAAVRKPTRALVGRYLLACIGVLAVQIVLGGLTVLQLLASWTVTSHLLVGNAFAASMGLVAVTLWRGVDPAPRPALGSPWIRPLLIGIGVLLVAQMALGGLVASQHAGTACTEWPACVGSIWFPTWVGPVGLHVTHRLTAYALAALVGVLVVLTWNQDSLGRKARLAGIVVLAQVALGVANVLMHLPVEVTAGHSAGAACLCLLTALLIQDSWQRPRSDALPSPQPVPEAA